MCPRNKDENDLTLLKMEREITDIKHSLEPISCFFSDLKSKSFNIGS